MRACALLRSTSHYKAEIWRAGLARHGYSIETEWRRRPEPSDLLLLWNRPRGYEAIAEHYERAGATVLIAENGYLPGPSGGKTYALARNFHNGAGRWFVGDESRYPIADYPWRTGGNHVLVLPQRGIGSQGVAMPRGWPQDVMKRLQAITDRPIRFRPHPGGNHKPLEPDLAGAHCVVTWASGGGVKALRAGVPVFYEMPKWVGSCAATRLAGSIEACNTPSRSELWTRITWAQWTIDEISSGEAFERLLNEEDHRLLCGGKSPLDAGRERYDARAREVRFSRHA